MDLLNQNQYEEDNELRGKKTILKLLIIAVIAAILILILMVYLSLQNKKVLGDFILVNNVQYNVKNNLIISDQNGNKYIALKDLANLLNYQYYSNAYPEEGEDINKCYIKNNTLITSFEKDSNTIYKYQEGTNLDYQYYELKFNIIMENDKLYIALDDLRKSLNVVCSINKNNVISIETASYIVAKHEKELSSRGYKITNSQNNTKAIAYGWLIVSKDDSYSVINTNYEEIISSKYSYIYFDEKNLNYIVANHEGKYGIISIDGTIKLSLKYDGLEILNYENTLYKVQYNNKYGIVKADGTLLTPVVYDDIGYQAEPSNRIMYTLIIPELDGKSGETIVVKRNKKYGLIYLETGTEFIKCNEIDKIYAVENLEKIDYKIEVDNNTFYLIEYIEYINKTR